MNTCRNITRTHNLLECLLMLAAAALLLRASFVPVIEIKGFDTFALESVALWATRIARITLGAAVLCLLVKPLGVSRWWLALSVGIMIGPLTDMAMRAVDLAKMMATDGPGNINDLIVIRTGTWLCAAGLGCWLLDLAVATSRRVCAWRGGNNHA